MRMRPRRRPTWDQSRRQSPRYPCPFCRTRVTWALAMRLTWDQWVCRPGKNVSSSCLFFKYAANFVTLYCNCCIITFRIACVAGGSGWEHETFCCEAANSLAGYAREGIFASGVDSSPFFSRPARLFALAFGTEVRAGTHSRRLRRLHFAQIIPRCLGQLKTPFVFSLGQNYRSNMYFSEVQIVEVSFGHLRVQL